MDHTTHPTAAPLGEVTDLKFEAFETSEKDVGCRMIREFTLVMPELTWATWNGRPYKVSTEAGLMKKSVLI